MEKKRGNKMDPIEKIIDRLKKEYGESEGSYILDLFYKEEFKNHFLTGQGYQNITGFLYGLQATNFITIAEVNETINYLIELQKNI